MKKRIILTGGGTGGHIWPLIAVADKLTNRYQVIYLGQRGGPEEQVALDHQLKFEGIRTAKFQGWAILNPLTWLSQLIGFCQSLSLIRRYRPSLILAKGGFVAFPVAAAGRLLGVKLILHESDSVIGRANRLLLPLAFRFLVAFPKEYYPYLTRSKMIAVGIPTRPEFKESRLPRQPALLFLGGSQGSYFINRLVKEVTPHLLKKIKIIHICGPNNLSEMKKFREGLSKKLKANYRLYGFTPRIKELIKDSSLVISRAGATSLVEIGQIKRPVILIPFPQAASNHQLVNGKILAKKGAAVVFRQNQIDGHKLKKEIRRLLKSAQERKKLADNLHNFWPTDSRERIVEMIESIV
jgi:UDP-N-acetylglucosamine--N-acetylmuramyl-(pentapeptide) pyrophosphoryl-undecaprenol N-acetylglucosamine transferase